MADSPVLTPRPDSAPLELVPRLKEQGYSTDDVERRRRWVEEKTGCRLTHVGSHSIPSESMRGNVENPIGAAQMPLGVAGPLLIHGVAANGTFYVPLATTEGALVRSYERGMAALTRAGGACVRIYTDENRVSPVFFFDDVASAHEFARGIEHDLDWIRSEAESTTRHGKLLRLECSAIGREVIVHFCYFTADAQGMNMIVKATDKACRLIMDRKSGVRGFQIFSGHCSEKRASGFLFAGGKGKRVVAGARLPEGVVKSYLHTTPQQLIEMWHHTMLGHVSAAAVGYNGHYANGLAALFIACGQDVANIVNASVGITNFELTNAGELYASVTLPSLTVATVGGGTNLGTSRECLAMLGCAGAGYATKFSEIVAATLLAGELSMGASIASGEFVQAHEEYGRNRP
ncbi:MAG: hydroxymethylglutaryl-CoA reductase [Acidobacteriota bacterium]|jgi:hydroxymethylglutaryl-CoA reductase (NADPH)|nr:hydroxymethylglutaryl-CoA reductase [Acidobacteriota bacterium]